MRVEKCWNIDLIKTMHCSEIGGGGGYLVLVNYQSAFLSNLVPLYPPNYFFLSNIDEMDYFL